MQDSGRQVRIAYEIKSERHMLLIWERKPNLIQKSKKQNSYKKKIKSQKSHHRFSSISFRGMILEKWVKFWPK